jgi:hypothetical protein
VPPPPPETPAPKPEPIPKPSPPERKPVAELKVSDKAVAWVIAQESWHPNEIKVGKTIAFGTKVTEENIKRLQEKYPGGVPKEAKDDPNAVRSVQSQLNAQLTKLSEALPGLKVSQQEADALASLAYNSALFKNKDLLAKLEAGAKPEDIAEHFFDWIKSGEKQGGDPTGKPAEPSQGLLERRIGETRIFLLGRYEKEGPAIWTLGKELVQERKAGRRIPAVQRALALPKSQEVK